MTPPRSPPRPKPEPGYIRAVPSMAPPPQAIQPQTPPRRGHCRAARWQCQWRHVGRDLVGRPAAQARWPVSEIRLSDGIASVAIVAWLVWRAISMAEDACVQDARLSGMHKQVERIDTCMGRRHPTFELCPTYSGFGGCIAYYGYV